MFVAIKYTNREVKYNSKLAGKHSLLMNRALSEGSLFYKWSGVLSFKSF